MHRTATSPVWIKEEQVSRPGTNAKRDPQETPSAPTSAFIRTVQEKSMTRSFAYAVAILALVTVGTLAEMLGRYRAAEIAHERTARALAFASELRARSDRELNAALYLASGVVGYLVVRHDKIDSKEINEILAAVYTHARHIRNFAIAIGTRITYIYPRAGNEAVIGKD